MKKLLFATVAALSITSFAAVAGATPATGRMGDAIKEVTNQDQTTSARKQKPASQRQHKGTRKRSHRTAPGAAAGSDVTSPSQASPWK